MEQPVTVGGTAARLRVAVLQTAPSRGAIGDNLRQIEEMLAAVPAADLVLTPEMSVPGFAFRPDQVPTPMSADDARLSALAEFPGAVSVGIVEESGVSKPHNSAVLLGRTKVIQRKLHLISYAPWNEQECYAPGNDLEPASVNGVQVATLICNDAWHPVMPWLAAQSGAEVLLVPSSSLGRSTTDEVAKTWDAILTHTARALQCFVVFANRCGLEDGEPFWGGSRIIGPRGELLAQAGGTVETIQAELDVADLRELRRTVPLLAEARPDLVVRHLQRMTAGAKRV